MSAKPDVSVVILEHDKPEDARACVASVAALAYEPLRIVVIDNGSRDPAPVAALGEEFPGVEVVRSPTNLGCPGGRNFGLRHVFDHHDPDYVLFLDDDTVVSPQSLDRLVAALEADATAGIACPKAFQAHPSERLMSCGIHVDLARASVYDIGTGEIDRGRYDEAREVPACGAFAFLLRADLLRELRGFDDRFNPYGWGEIDLCLRARALGMRTLYVPSAVVRHAGGRIGRGRVPSLETYKARNYLRLMERHARPADWLGCLFFLPWRVFSQGLTDAARGDFSVFAARIRGLREWMRTRADA